MTSKTSSRRILILSRHAPYSSSLPRSALDTALAAAAFDQHVNLAFVGDGVLHLMPGQDAKCLGMRNLEQVLASLPLYEIETVYADAAALADYAIDTGLLPENVQVIDAAQLRDLLVNHDHLLGF